MKASERDFERRHVSKSSDKCGHEILWRAVLKNSEYVSDKHTNIKGVKTWNNFFYEISGGEILKYTSII